MKNKNRNILLLILGFLVMPIFTSAQEFTLKKTKAQLAEEKANEKRRAVLEKEKAYHKFQDHFFDAIHQKAKEDYTRAIEALEDCKQIYPNDPGMNFEFAKNYLLLKDYENAIFFDEEVLKVKPNEIYVLKHLQKVYRAQNDTESAIAIQQKIIKIRPTEKSSLIMLYVANRQKDKAKEVYLELEKTHQYIPNRDYYKRVLFRNKAHESLQRRVAKRKKEKAIKKELATKKPQKPTKISPKDKPKKIVNAKVSGSVKNLQEIFNSSKNYNSLKKLITKEKNLKRYDLIIADCKKGLEYFPAQTYLYLMQGKAQNKTKEYTEAVEVLLAGLDFIIDDKETTINFYEQIIKAYKGLGNNKEASKYTAKIQSLRSAK